MSLQTMGARAMQAGLNATYDLPVNDWMNFDSKLDAVTIDDLAAFAETYFKEEQRLELIVRPEEA
jgi:predicted Zn-dependent peptidase